MKRSTIFLFLFSLAAQVAAQTPRTLADEVLRRALGNIVAPVDAIILAERRQGTGPAVPLRIQIQGNRKVRYEVGTGRDMQVFVYTEGGGWRQTGGGAVESLAPQVTRHRPALIPFLDLLSDVDKPTATVSGGSLRQLGPATAYHLNVRLPDPAPNQRFRREPLDEVVDVFIDPNTLFVVRTERVLISDSDLYFRVPVVTDYSDYRNVQGRAVPFRIVYRTGTANTGIWETTTTILSVQFNQGVSDSAFVLR